MFQYALVVTDVTQKLAEKPEGYFSFASSWLGVVCIFIMLVGGIAILAKDIISKITTPSGKQNKRSGTKGVGPDGGAQKPVQEASQQPAQQPVQETRQPVQEPAQQPAQKPVQEASQQPKTDEKESAQTTSANDQNLDAQIEEPVIQEKQPVTEVVGGI